MLPNACSLFTPRYLLPYALCAIRSALFFH
jgi:hypothetical protein